MKASDAGMCLVFFKISTSVFPRLPRKDMVYLFRVQQGKQHLYWIEKDKRGALMRKTRYTVLIVDDNEITMPFR